MINPFRRRLPRSAVAWFAAAALAAVVGAATARAHVDRLEATRPDVGPPTEVVVAATDLTRGATLADPALSVTDVPSSLVPPGAMTGTDQAIGRVLAADLARGEILTETRLTGAGSGPMAALVPPGLRAFVLPSGPPAGTLRPGDEVDVLATYGANAGRPYTETVAMALQVLDIVEGAPQVAGSSAGAQAGPPIVVLADPLTVERLARAASLALLSIAIVGDDGAVVADLAAGSDPVAAQPTNGPSP